MLPPRFFAPPAQRRLDNRDAACYTGGTIQGALAHAG